MTATKWRLLSASYSLPTLRRVHMTRIRSLLLRTILPILPRIGVRLRRLSGQQRGGCRRARLARLSARSWVARSVAFPGRESSGSPFCPSAPARSSEAEIPAKWLRGIHRIFAKAQILPPTPDGLASRVTSPNCDSERQARQAPRDPGAIAALPGPTHLAVSISPHRGGAASHRLSRCHQPV